MPSRRLLHLVLVLCLVAPWGGRAWAEEESPGPTPAEEDVSLDERIEAWIASPDSMETGVALQDALLSADRKAEATKLFRTAQLRNRKSSICAFLYGRILGGRDGLRRMHTALDRDSSLGGSPPSGLRAAWRSLREAERKSGAWDRAAAAAERVLAHEPEAWDWAAAGYLRERVGDVEGGMAAYRRALALRSDYVWIRNSLALLLARHGEIEKAVELARATVEASPTSGSAHLHLGLVLCLQGETDAGREAYAAALRCAGEDADALAAVGVAYTDIEDYDLAEQALKRALQRDPDHERARVSAGVLALERGDPARALTHLSRAVALRPKDAHVVFLRGMCHERLGQEAKAVKDYRKAAKLRSDVPLYLKGWARLLGTQGSVDSAISVLRKAMRLDPRSADLELQLGFLLMKKKRWADALKAMRRAADLDAEDPRPWFYIAILSGDRLRRPQDALRALRVYKELGGREPSALRWLQELESD